MTEYYLWLLQLMGAANPDTHALLQEYGSVEEIYRAVKINRDAHLLSAAVKKRLETATLENSELILKHCEKNKIKIVTIDNENYPNALRNIYNPPVLLFYKGNIDGLDDEICIAGVGARSATEYTAKVTLRTCSDLAKLGVVLISGMAVGVDCLVHQSAVERSARTIGVLACGLDIDYPKGSIPMRERIYQCGGACISELMPQENTSRNYFQARNRLISGLSAGVMIFQADMTSGSLLTASHALQQGRDIFCVPPCDVFSPIYSGVVPLLRDGAIPLFNYLDVVNAYYSAFSEQIAVINHNNKFSINPEKHFVFTKNKPDESKVKAKTDRKTIANEEKAAAPKQYDLSDYSEQHQKVVDFLKSGMKNLEAITSSCHISPDDIAEIMIDLELAGIVKASAGANYELI